MEKLNSFAASPGADFYGAFQAADPSNSAIDSEIASYLNNNPDGIEFSYGGKDYLLAKDQTTNKYTLHLQTPSGSVLKDEDVQMNTKYAPDGFVEIGGLSKAGTRLFIGRAPDNVEQVIAFEGAHDTSDVSFRPENAVVLYDGSKKPIVEEPAAGTEQPGEPVDFGDVYNGWTGGGGATVPLEPETGGGGATVPLEPETGGGGATVPLEPETVGDGATVPTDTNTQPAVSDEVVDTDSPVNIDESPESPPPQPTTTETQLRLPKQLPDGQFELKSDNYWYDSDGEIVGISYDEPGIYQITGGEVSRQLDVGSESGVFIPADPNSGTYMMGASFKNSAGETQVASYEFLREMGVPTDQIKITYFDPLKEPNLDFSVVEKDGEQLIVDVDGKVLGSYFNMPQGNYTVKQDNLKTTIYIEVVLNGDAPIFVPFDVYSGQYDASGQNIFDGNGDPMKNEDGSQMKATPERLQWLGLFS